MLALPRQEGGVVNRITAQRRITTRETGCRSLMAHARMSYSVVQFCGETSMFFSYLSLAPEREYREHPLPLKDGFPSPGSIASFMAAAYHSLDEEMMNRDRRSSSFLHVNGL
jgi:hypothetical protein